MSTIRVDNFGPSAGGTTYSARGIAKAWVNFNGTGTIAARDSENVSSLTDNGTGNYTVNISNDMANGNYACLTTSGNDAGAGTGSWSVPASAALSTASNIELRGYSMAGGFEDQDQYMSAFFGDLA